MKGMTQAVMASVTVLVCISLMSCAQSRKEVSAEKAKKQEVDAARQVADAWLQLVDSGNYAESWDEAAESFRTETAKAMWRDFLRIVRQPLGKPVSRTVKLEEHGTVASIDPPEECVFLEYETSLLTKKTVVESVTLMKDKGGKWRVAAYFNFPEDSRLDQESFDAELVEVGEERSGILMAFDMFRMLESGGIPSRRDYLLDEQSFDAEWLKVVEQKTGIPIPAGSRGLNMFYQGQVIDPSLHAKVEIPASSEEALAKHIEEIHSTGSIGDSSMENLSWWNPADATKHVERAYQIETGWVYVLLCEEDGRRILYLLWFQV